MARDLHDDFKAELITTDLKPRILASFDFSSGAVNVWSGVGNLTYDSKTWTGVGNLGNVTPADSGVDISAQGATFTLTGISSSLISTALGDDYQNRACEWRLALLDANDAVIANAYKWQGRMDVLTIAEEADTSTITVTAENRLIDLDRPRSSRYNDRDQQERYSGDKGLRFAADMADLELHWGSTDAARRIPNRDPNEIDPEFYYDAGGF